MKPIYYLSILFVTVTMMSSCENELPFNINNNPPKLVMNALINAESTDNLLFLNFTSKENSTHVQNVTVEVRINGELKESLRPLPPETEGNPQCRFGITSRFTPGDAVRIDAITDDGQYHAWTEINVPQRPFEIENVDTVTVPLAQSGYTTEYLRYRITINDRPNETNYYRIVIDKQTTLWGYNHEEGGDDYIYWTKHSYNFIGREDVVLTDGQPTTGDDEDNGLFDTAKNIYGVFDDTRFRNTSYTMTVYNNTKIETGSDSGYFSGMDVIIRLMSITETEYYYLKALNLVDSDAYDETINEPIKYPSNVHGGTGMVGISTEVTQTIHIISSSHSKGNLAPPVHVYQ